VKAFVVLACFRPAACGDFQCSELKEVLYTQGKPERETSRGRPRSRWEDNIIMVKGKVFSVLN
jgi:hypothetical protein